MTIRLFDVQNAVIVPTEHCYTLKSLKDIMDNYPKNYLKIYMYLFYMSCPDPDNNPFFNTPEIDKEEIILREISSDFSTEDTDIYTALEFCKRMYETPTYRAYKGIASMLDRLARFMEVTPITTGRDGNGSFLLKAASDYKGIRESFKGTYKDLQEEQASAVRGGIGLAYDS